MTTDEIEKCFGEMKYERDVRNPPDPRRLGRFQAGWKAASQRDYTERTLKELTWDNLGYRFGKCSGSVDEKEIRNVYEYVAKKHKPAIA